MSKLIVIILVLTVSVPGFYASKTPLLKNGTEAEPGQFPFLAYLLVHYNLTDYRDAAFLISDRHLLTKATRLVINASNITVTLGALIQGVDDPEEVKYRIERDGIIIPEGATSTGTKDPAILVLPESVKFTPRIQPVLLPRWSETKLDYIGLNGTAVGWVYHDAGGIFLKLKLAYRDGVRIGHYDECKCDSDMLCVPEEITDGGEAGAPIILDTPDGWVAIGIYSVTSLFIEEGIGGTFIATDVYIRINNHLDFISENTGIYIRP